MPAWTYQQLKAIDAALNPQIEDAAVVATLLNGQSVTLPPQRVGTRQALDILIRTPTFDWSRIVIRSRGTISNPSSPTGGDQAVYAAIAAITLLESTTQLDLADATSWAIFSGALSILQAAGDVSATSVSALTTLRTPTVAKWEPPVTDQDIMTARLEF